jgi:hypothetical protein
MNISWSLGGRSQKGAMGWKNDASFDLVASAGGGAEHTCVKAWSLAFFCRR